MFHIIYQFLFFFFEYALSGNVTVVSPIFEHTLNNNLFLSPDLKDNITLFASITAIQRFSDELAGCV